MATLYNHASALENANGGSGTFVHQPGGRQRNRLVEGLQVYPMAALPVKLDINLTALGGTGTPGAQFIYESSWDGGITWNQVYDSTALTAPATVATQVLGQGGKALGNVGRLRWVLTGTTPTATFTASVTTVY